MGKDLPGKHYKKTVSVILLEIFSNFSIKVKIKAKSFRRNKKTFT